MGELTEFCIKLYQSTGNVFSSSNLNTLMNYAVNKKHTDLCRYILDLYDNVKPGLFWGSLLYQNVKRIENDALSFFNMICAKIKVHCKGKEKIIANSLNKFNTRSMDDARIANWNEVQLECIETMKNVLGYDPNSIVPVCCSKNKLGFIQFLMEEEILDYNICKKNGYMDKINELVAFGQKKRNKRDCNSEFENVLKEFVANNADTQ